MKGRLIWILCFLRSRPESGHRALERHLYRSLVHPAQQKRSARTPATDPSRWWPRAHATKRAIAECPTGTDLTGVMGGVSTGAYGKIALTGFQPSSKQGLAMGREIGGGTTANWSVTAHAICIKAGSLRGLDQVLNVSSVDSPPICVVYALCPDGKTVISGGATVWNTDGAYAREVVLSGVIPQTDGKGMIAIASQTLNGTSNTWYAVAYAICISN